LERAGAGEHAIPRGRSSGWRRISRLAPGRARIHALARAGRSPRDRCAGAMARPIAGATAPASSSRAGTGAGPARRRDPPGRPAHAPQARQGERPPGRRADPALTRSRPATGATIEHGQPLPWGPRAQRTVPTPRSARDARAAGTVSVHFSERVGAFQSVRIVFSGRPWTAVLNLSSKMSWLHLLTAREPRQPKRAPAFSQHVQPLTTACVAIRATGWMMAFARSGLLTISAIAWNRRLTFCPVFADVL